MSDIVKLKPNGVQKRNFQNINDPVLFSKLSAEIQTHIEKEKLFIVIQKNKYPMVEAWQYAGALVGLFPRIVKLEDKSTRPEEFRYMAEVEIVDQSNDKIVTRAFAYCSNGESKKKYFDEYAIASMAQTRAVGKAFRVLLGWLFKAAGYQGTPSEEMDEFTPETKKDPTAAVIRAEYKKYAIRAMKALDRAKDVKELSQIARSFHEDADFIDTAKATYENIRNAGG